MALIEWRKEFETGVPDVDFEHRELVDLINALHAEIGQGADRTRVHEFLGEVFARITNPTSIGGFVSVFLTGLDGTLACEVRDALWTPDRLPRGSCDNGVVFGLPD